MVTSKGFVNLHTHTEFSTFDGIARVGKITERAKTLGMTALAITDHGSLSGTYKFSNAAKAAGIKPIIGIELYMAIGSRFEKNSMEIARDDYDGDDDAETAAEAKSATKHKYYEHLTVLARNTEGWKNLLAIHNAAQETVWYKPRADYDLLKKHGEGLIILTGCLAGPIAGALLREDEAEAKKNLETLIDCVGKENVYLEIMDHGIAAEDAVMDGIVALSNEYGIPMVATNDSHYTMDCDDHAHDGFLAVGSNKNLSDPNRFRFNGSGYHLKSEAEMRSIHPEWDEWQDAVSMSQVIADRCEDSVIPAPVLRLPQFTPPKSFKDAKDYLWFLIEEGVEVKYGTDASDAVWDRLESEMKVICDAGFESYFLIGWDMLEWCRTQDILLGFGRGSAAGSLVSYVLGLVGVDPLDNNLLFERFLEPGRTGMPDIDFDVSALRRGEVLDYLRERWGDDKVARIGSFGVSLSKASIKSAGRILGMGPVADALTKLVPVSEGKPMTFSELYDPANRASDDFRNAVNKYGSSVDELLELARSFEGITSSNGIHACGVLITDVPLAGLVPIRRNHAKDADENSMAITCWDGKDVEKYQLLKLDVLSLRNLDVVSEALASIERVTGETLELEKLPHPDTKGDGKVDAAWDLLCKGQTAGIFQMESEGMAKVSQSIGPRSLNDLSVVNALYRPGPLSAGMPDSYAARKNGMEPVSYTRFTSDAVETEWIAKVLGDTYGMAIFQETIMRLSTVISGFDAGQRSRLRKAMGKKDKTEMDAVHNMWLSGSTQEFKDEAGEIISPVFREETAKALWEFIEGSASYLFNASHSVAYAALAFVTAYLKANYPSHYGAAILAVTDDADKRLAAISALREDGIEILAPDLNKSLAGSSSDGSVVLLGLTEIKDVGSNGKAIVADRERNGEYKSLSDLMNRVKVQSKNAKTPSALSISTVERLIESGALDCFGSRLGLTMIVRAAKKNPEITVPDAEWDILELSARQRQRLGIALGEHPMDVLRDKLDAWTVPFSEKGANNAGVFAVGEKPTPLRRISKSDGSAVLTTGIVASWTERNSHNGMMASFTLEDGSTIVAGTIWADSLTALKRRNGVPAIGSIAAVSGTVRVRTFEREVEDGEPELIQTSNLIPTAIWNVKVKAPSRFNLPRHTEVDIMKVLDAIESDAGIEEDELFTDFDIQEEPVVAPKAIVDTDTGSGSSISNKVSLWSSTPGMGRVEVQRGLMDAAEMKLVFKSAPYSFETEDATYLITHVKSGDQAIVIFSESESVVRRKAYPAHLDSRSTNWAACSGRKPEYRWEQLVP